MRLLLDEMLSPQVARILRDRGHDVEAVGEHREWAGRADVQVMRLARGQRRAVVTDNVRDFRPLHAGALASGEGHFGMILIPPGHRRTRADVGTIAAALEAQLTAHPRDEDLANGEAWI